MKTLSPHAQPPSSSQVSILGGQALVLDVEGTWRKLTGVKVTKAVTLGDLSKQIEVPARGRDSGSEEYGERHGDEAGERSRRRSRRSRSKSGSQGRLGGRAHVPDCGGEFRSSFVRNVGIVFAFLSSCWTIDAGSIKCDRWRT
jgi:hypothetical protein